LAEIHSIAIHTLAGAQTTLGELIGDRVALLVNVASRCGYTGQYAKLEALQRELGPDSFTVVGLPCNQFGGQEPGSPEAIAEFCSATYGVTFPMTAKIDVNGPDRHPVYEILTREPDASGGSGDVEWNFEKFVIGADGAIAGRFRPEIEPDSHDMRVAIDRALATRSGWNRPRTEQAEE
jgi:glutathione peroxidase